MTLRVIAGLVLAGMLGVTEARGQGVPESQWSVEAAIGWDNGISGNVHSAGIGVLNGLPTVIEERSYDEVYGTGVQWRFGAGYMLDDRQEIIGRFTIQSISADALRVGTVASADLFATFDDYNSFAIEGGYRYHFTTDVERLRPYGAGLIGIAVIDEIDANFAAPSIGLTRDATDFYDGTAAFTFGFEGGILYGFTEQVDLNVNLGFRYTSGLSEVDGLQGTGLEDINDDSGRWTLPFMVGVRFRF
jgi:Outer membrane protein beta-barrel domain